MKFSKSTAWFGAVVLSLIAVTAGFVMRSLHLSHWESVEASSAGEMSPEAWQQIEADANGFARLGAIVGAGLFLGLGAGLLALGSRGD